MTTKLKTGWTITEDPNGYGIAGITGPCNGLNRDEILNHPDQAVGLSKLQFRVFSDDDELDCAGWMVDDGSESSALGPLDDYCGPSLGSSYMMTLENGEWKHV